ncbi:hypothetical protein DY218_09190 [Streptomyces triticagri]|uniref:Electron transfer flavoprotein small subunit n=1 Tax=Streptomyces triticagri TaxID=2293568 RepID=A0A372M905_9ACTN|nr:FAD-binding protein [Streptomyces triticagri]RFU86995.1 hypothetical protein DY218_09190 [Streptomyces triticagri]
MTAPQDRPLRIAVLVKQVPAYGDVTELDGRGRLVRSGRPAELNAWCRRAVARAVELARASGGMVTAITMGPPPAVDVLREALACGADEALQLCDAQLAGADCLVTARALAAGLRTLPPLDLVVAGHSSTDGATGAVAPMVAALMGLPFAGPALTLRRQGAGRRLHCTLQRDDGNHETEVRLPAVISVAERSGAVARAERATWPGTERIRRVPLSRLAGASPASGSPTRVLDVTEPAARRRPILVTDDLADAGRIMELVRRRLDAGPAQDEPPVAMRWAPADPDGGTATGDGAWILAVCAEPDGPAARALLGAAADVAAGVGGHVVAAGPGGDLRRLSAWGADTYVGLDGLAPRPAADALAAWAQRRGVPAAVVGGATAWDRELLARLGVLLDGGLLSDLTEIRHDTVTGRLIGTKPAGAALALVASSARTQLATVRTGCLPLRPPRAPGRLPVRALSVAPDPAVTTLRRMPRGDADALDRAPVVLGIGAGVPQECHHELKPLQAVLGAELAGTRKVTDSGALPHERQLGITGRAVAPRLYLAIGVSGSWDHLVGVQRADTVFAVNCDPAAEIFTHCDFGLIADWRTAVRALTREAERATPSPAST